MLLNTNSFIYIYIYYKITHLHVVFYKTEFGLSLPFLVTLLKSDFSGFRSEIAYYSGTSIKERLKALERPVFYINRFVISRFFFFFICFTITGVKKIVHYTEEVVISRFHCTLMVSTCLVFSQARKSMSK